VTGWIITGLVAFSTVSIDGCRTQTGTNRSRILARVGDATLTIEEAKLHIDTTLGGVDAQLRSYVSSWVNTELMYLEARRLGIDRSEMYEERLADATRQLAGQVLLDRTIYDESLTVSAETLHSYYTAHATEFFIHDDIAKLNIATFNGRERASEFAGKISQGATWNAAASEHRKDTTGGSAILSSAAGVYYTARSLFPQELWKVVQGLDLNEVSFPIKTPAGFAVVQLLGRFKQGAQATFELAHDEVRQRVLLEHRRQQFTQLLETLRQRYAVQLFVDSPNTSDSARTHE